VSSISYRLGGSAAERDSAMRHASLLSTALEKQAPDMGTYSNEAFIHQSDFRKAFWGDHHDRLLVIKRQIDPAGVFWCPVCVGAEDWVQQSNGVVCKV
jgi:hypothetical protein